MLRRAEVIGLRAVFRTGCRRGIDDQRGAALGRVLLHSGLGATLSLLERGPHALLEIGGRAVGRDPGALALRRVEPGRDPRQVVGRGRARPGQPVDRGGERVVRARRLVDDAALADREQLPSLLGALGDERAPAREARDPLRQLAGAPTRTRDEAVGLRRELAVRIFGDTRQAGRRARA